MKTLMHQMNLPHLSPNITEKDILYVLRTNTLNKEKLIDKIHESGEGFNAYFLDGDKWSERDIWKDGYQYDSKTALALYEMATYKDAVFMFSDEFIIFDTKDLTEEIEAYLSDKDFTMTMVSKEITPTDTWRSVWGLLLKQMYEEKG